MSTQGSEDGDIGYASFTRDGGVVFSSAAADFVPGDTSAADDVFELRLR
ncbi:MULTISPECIES: hypothetical protein [unclassified Streptomyces]